MTSISRTLRKGKLTNELTTELTVNKRTNRRTEWWKREYTNQDWTSGLDIGIGHQDWTSGLDIRVGHRDWTSGLDMERHQEEEQAYNKRRTNDI